MLKKNVQYLPIVGSAGIYLFAFGIFSGPAVSSLGLSIMGMVFISEFIHRPSLVKDPLFLLSLVFFIYLFCRILLALHVHGPSEGAVLNAGREYAQLGFLFILVPAVSINRFRPDGHLIIFLLMAGLLFRVMDNVALEEIRTLMDIRPGFGLPVNHFGCYAAVALLYLLIYAGPFWGPRENRVRFFLRSAGWAGLVVFWIFGLRMSASRSALLGFTIMTPLIFICMMKKKRTAPANFLKTGLICLLAAGIFFTAVYGVNRDLVHQRVIPGFAVIWELLTGKPSDDVVNRGNMSVVARFDLWGFGIKKMTEKPLFGWGPGTPRDLLRTCDKKSFRMHEADGMFIGHFHNFLLQLLIEIGLVGGLLYFTSLFIILKVFFTAYREGWIDTKLALFLLGGFSMFFIANNFNMLMGNNSGRNFVGLLGGIAYSYYEKVYPNILISGAK
ncbi:O-antigen ligase family protein [Desulfobacter sp.]